MLDHLELLEKQLDDIDSMLADMHQRLMSIRESALGLCVNTISKQ